MAWKDRGRISAYDSPARRPVVAIVPKLQVSAMAADSPHSTYLLNLAPRHAPGARRRWRTGSKRRRPNSNEPNSPCYARARARKSEPELRAFWPADRKPRATPVSDEPGPSRVHRFRPKPAD